MFEKFKPLNDRILIKRLEEESKTASGLIIPDAAKEKAQTGRVIAAGAGRIANDGRLIPTQVQVGDKIFFSKYAGTEAGNDHLIIREDEILGILG